MIAPSLLADLAPTGKLRVGINYGNLVLASKDPASGELRGVAVDLGREIGRRVGVPVELVGFEAAGKMFDAVKAGAWDIAFLAVDPGRAGEIDFAPPYIEIEGVYLAPAGSALRVNADVDRDGIRVGVSGKSAYDLFLSRELKKAQLVRASSQDTAIDLILSGKVDVLAGVRQHLEANLAKVPGGRIFPQRFMVIQQSLGIVKGRAAGAKYLREFIEDVKASGFVAQAIKKAAIQGVSIAPPAARA